MFTYTAYKLNLDGSLSHKEHLNNIDEVNAWLAEKHSKFANVKIVQDQTGKAKILTSVGDGWLGC